MPPHLPVTRKYPDQNAFYRVLETRYFALEVGFQESQWT